MTVRRLKLIEYRKEPAYQLSVDERDGLRRLHPGITIEPALGHSGRYDITADQRIGIVCLPALTVEICPKVPLESVLFVISYGCDAISWSDKRPEFADQPDLVEALAIMFARIVQHVTRHGLLNGYRCEDEPLRVLRGRLRFDEQIRRRFRIIPPLEVRHDLFTPDTHENRLLLSALDLLGRIPRCSASCRREIFRAQRLFGGVQAVRFHRVQDMEVHYNQLNRHYRPAIELAKLVLQNASLDLGDGGPNGSAFLIDMNCAFERFVRRALREAIGVDVGRIPGRAPSARMDEAGSVPLKPDLCLMKNRRVLWVGDAKYKRLPAGAYRNADLYQLLAYTIALDLNGGMLIYAADEGVRSAEHVVANCGKQLRVVTLDLSVSRERIRSQIKWLAQAIRQSGEREAARIVRMSRRAG